MLTYFCPDCFDDNPDRPGYEERGRLVGSGGVLEDARELGWRA